MSFEKLPSDLLRKHKGVSFAGVATCCFCYDEQGRFFLAKRSKNARDEQGRWEVGGGGLKMGSTLEKNVIRELKEEFNTKPLKLDCMGYREIFRELEDGTKTHWIAHDFAALVDPSSMSINEPEMFDDIGWFTRSKLPTPLHSQQLVFFSQYKDILDKIGIK